MKTTYITTPLYYVNASPHIGHSYTSIAADCLARYRRLRGEPVFLLTGTDEHGQKIEQAAAAAGQAPPAFVDEVVERFRSLWALLGITYDDFIRTTQPRHTKAVQAILMRLYEQGTLIKASYQGWYCTPDETFWTDAELEPVQAGAAAPLCPACRRPLEPVTEDGWHLPLEASRPWLKAFVASHPGFVRPASRYNELASLLEQPLPEALCITRPSRRVGWGIPVPFSADHVTYVWFDALLNYITVPGYVEDPGRFASLWPADVHFIGKDILRHHAVYWPIILHAIGLPDDQMPAAIFAHGWWKIGEQKMSKSLGNIVDPTAVVTGLLSGQPFAADVYRYFLLREIPFGQDGSFSEDAILKRLTADLANDLGNLVNRTISMIGRYMGGQLPVRCTLEATQQAMVDEALALAGGVVEAMERIEFSAALERIMGLVTRANQYIETAAPWKLAKSGPPERLHSVLTVVAQTLRIIAITLEPFMPSVAEEMWRQLGCQQPRRWQDASQWGCLAPGQRIGTPQVLFPKPATSVVG